MQKKRDGIHPKLKIVVANIRKIREFRNYSQDYLAIKMGISQNAYSKMELGYTNVTIVRLYDIALILEVGIKELLELEVDKLEKVFLQKM